VSFVIIFIINHGIWSNVPSVGEALLASIGSTVVLTAVFFVIWEAYSKLKAENKALSDRITQLEAQSKDKD
jgi:hypothetical protein